MQNPCNPVQIQFDLIPARVRLELMEIAETIDEEVSLHVYAALSDYASANSRSWNKTMEQQPKMHIGNSDRSITVTYFIGDTISAKFSSIDEAMIALREQAAQHMKPEEENEA